MIAETFEFTPSLLLTMWAAGTAGGAALVAYWKIVGRGYTWLSGSTVVGMGLGAWFFDPRPLLLVGIVVAFAAILMSGRNRIVAALLGLSMVAFLAEALSSGAPILAISGSAALGGITAEMLLGHWYLVSPQMPRWALRRLDIVGAVAISVDAALLIVGGALVGIDGLGGLVFAVLASMTVLLMVGVWFSLGEPSYPGVMAATGLSYLAVLTALGATALGRTLLDGSSSFGI